MEGSSQLDREMRNARWLNWEEERKEARQRHDALAEVLERLEKKLETVASHTHSLKAKVLPNVTG